MKKELRDDELFYKLNKDLLKNTAYTIYERLLMMYLTSYQVHDLICYEKNTDIAINLGISKNTLSRAIKGLVDKKIIFTTNKYKTHHSNNRKVIVLVDGNNPLPTKDETKQEVKKDKVKQPKVKKKIVAEKSAVEVIPPSEQLKESLEEFKKTMESYKPDVNPLKKYISDNADSIIKGYSFVDLNAMVRDYEINTMEELKPYFKIEDVVVDNANESSDDFIADLAVIQAESDAEKTSAGKLRIEDFKTK